MGVGEWGWEWGGGWRRGGEGEGVTVGVGWRGMYSGAPLYYMHKTCGI